MKNKEMLLKAGVTEIYFDDKKHDYISFTKSSDHSIDDIQFRCGDKVIAFDSAEELMAAIDAKQARYFSKDKTETPHIGYHFELEKLKGVENRVIAKRGCVEMYRFLVDDADFALLTEIQKTDPNVFTMLCRMLRISQGHRDQLKYLNGFVGSL